MLPQLRGRHKPPILQHAHPALLNIDILTIIFDGFDDRASAARCARVCSAWYDLASNAVWRVASLANLYDILLPGAPSHDLQAMRRYMAKAGAEIYYDVLV